MVAVSISVEGMFGLTWEHWRRLTTVVEQLGFDGLFRSDHFTLPFPVDLDSLEMIVSLTYLADHTERVHFGPLVAPISFRDPVMLAGKLPRSTTSAVNGLAFSLLGVGGSGSGGGG